MAQDEDGFLPAAFRKVQKIGKGLKSNGTSNIAGFLLRNRSSPSINYAQGVGKTERIVPLFTFYTSK